MRRVRLRLVGWDEGGVKENPADGTLRLVCRLADGGKVALWGTQDSRDNIDWVRSAGPRCEIECDSVTPASWTANEYGHTHWVPGDNFLQVDS